MNSFIFQAF